MMITQINQIQTYNLLNYRHKSSHSNPNLTIKKMKEISN